MTEERFEKMMEHAGDVIENTVEGVASLVDNSLFSLEQYHMPVLLA